MNLTRRRNCRWRMPLALAFSCTLAGCGILSSGTPPLSEVPPIDRSSPPNYRQITMNAAPSQLRGRTLSGAEISELQPTRLAQPGDWFACVRIPGDGGGDFAVFYENLAVREFRRAVQLDGCASLAYAPAPLPAGAVAPQQAVKKPDKKPGKKARNA